MEILRCRSREELDRRAALEGAEIIRASLRERGTASIVIATGMSQAGMLENLAGTPNVDWPRVSAFHLDEYIGISPSHVASFRRYLKERFVDLVPLRTFHFIDGGADPGAECRRLADLINRQPIQVAFIGIGENGHLAFNDPPADFESEQPYRVVQLDEACRRQQVGEKWFDRLEDVPTRAISMSIRQMMKAERLICSVPDARKAASVKAALEGPVTPSVPASILQRHPRASVYLDLESASLLERRAPPRP